jgi:hypothetical protein
MTGPITLASLIAILLVISMPSLTTAQDITFSVVPAVVRIDNLPPGETTVFKLTIHNKDDMAHVFTFTPFPPPQGERWEGRAALPDASWISFSPSAIEVDPDFAANVTVTVAIPPEQEWAGQDWEIWLGVSAKSSDLLGVRLFVRLLISSTSAAKTGFNAGLFVVIALAIVLLGYGAYYYFERKKDINDS